MAKKSSPNLRLQSSGRIFCRNEKNLIIQRSQLERFVEEIYDRLDTATTPRWIHITFSASISIFTFCLSPLITCSPEDLKPFLSMQPTTLHTCLVMLTILSAMVSLCAGIYILLRYLKYKDVSSRDKIREWAVGYVDKHFRDHADFVDSTYTTIPFHSDNDTKT